MKTIAVLTALLCMAAFCGCTAEDVSDNGPGRIGKKEAGEITDPDTGILNNDTGVPDTETPAVDPELPAEASDGETPAVEPEPENPNVLNAEIKRQIQQDLWDEYVPKATGTLLEHILSGSLTMEKVFHIPYYYGTYNGYVLIIARGLGQVGMGWRAVIGGIEFSNGNVSPFPWKGRSLLGIVCWKDHNIYTMAELYEQGGLTQEDLLAIADVQEKVWEAQREARKNHQ